MCLIIVSSPETTLTEADVEDYNTHNPNGFGAMWHEDGKVQIERTLNMDHAWAICRYLAGKQAVMHWRYATHGTVNLGNTHPFLINPSLGMVHNGILPCRDDDKSKSDTYVFAHEVMPTYLNGHTYVDESDVPKLNEWIGSGNRLVFLDDKARVTIVGKEKGLMHKGAWYSNTYAWTMPGAKSSWRSYFGDPRVEFDRHDDTSEYGALFSAGVDATDADLGEVIVVDEISPRDSRALENFRKDIRDMELSHSDYSDIGELVDWYCTRADDPPTLALLCWNAVREG